MNSEGVGGIHLDFHPVTEVEKHYLRSRSTTKALCYRCPGSRVEAHPFQERARDTQHGDKANAAEADRGLDPHNQRGLVRGRKNCRAVGTRRKIVEENARVWRSDRLRGIRHADRGDDGDNDSQEHDCRP